MLITPKFSVKLILYITLNKCESFYYLLRDYKIINTYSKRFFY